MLIPSDRHKLDDLRLWAELEAADLIIGRSPWLNDRVERSVQALRAFAATPCYIGVSWGKDSVVVAALARIAAPAAPLVHLRPTNHNPDCDAVRDAYFTAFPGQSYYEERVDYGRLHASGMGDDSLDKATDHEWYAAIRRVSERFGGRYVLGIRADESHGRRMRMRMWGESSPSACAPIGWWTTADVFAYLAVSGLPVHSAYGCLGGGRWPRERIRTAEIGDTHGKGGGRREWESEYYSDVLRRLEADAYEQIQQTTTSPQGVARYERPERPLHRVRQGLLPESQGGPARDRGDDRRRQGGQRPARDRVAERVLASAMPLLARRPSQPEGQAEEAGGMSKRYAVERENGDGGYGLRYDRWLVSDAEDDGYPVRLMGPDGSFVRSEIVFYKEAHAAAFAAALNLGDEAIKKEADRES